MKHLTRINVIKEGKPTQTYDTDCALLIIQDPEKNTTARIMIASEVENMKIAILLARTMQAVEEMLEEDPRMALAVTIAAAGIKAAKEDNK